jgi:hypothetical protein
MQVCVISRNAGSQDRGCAVSLDKRQFLIDCRLTPLFAVIMTKDVVPLRKARRNFCMLFLLDVMGEHNHNLVSFFLAFSISYSQDAL